GREKFLEKVWEWQELNSSQIINQVQQIGCAMDWKRIRFTLDDNLSRAVREAFVRLYEKGDIYRGTYIVNWCPSCGTAISDLEVDHDEIEGAFWYIAYPLADGSGEMVVSTTRPETMLADTAVAVNPADDRYKDLIGRHVNLPLMDIEIPIIGDDYVDIELGTGCLKITPAHDPNDYDIGLRHKLEMPKCIGPDGNMTDLYPPLAGMDRMEAREKVLELLEERGLMRGEQKHSHQVGHCFRCKTMIEPYVSDQWFLNMERIVKPAIEIVRDGRLKLITDKWNKVYFDWLENIRPWCISRQLWWGHRIPAWYCPKCGNEKVAHEGSQLKCDTCGGSEFEQDPDVLDTWFSSALWPFSTLGWPDETPEVETFYPGDVLCTAREIITLWVSRMVMMGQYCLGDIPFHDVFIHAMVQDGDGRKMSKSLGNG
ncbi:MAG: valine--tRNA ligase, partial [Phycisphaerae bacterium]|nr:valine--tRNA ligase [Phycisphaerae bacterium]